MENISTPTERIITLLTTMHDGGRCILNTRVFFTLQFFLFYVFPSVFLFEIIFDEKQRSSVGQTEHASSHYLIGFSPV